MTDLKRRNQINQSGASGAPDPSSKRFGRMTDSAGAGPSNRGAAGHQVDRKPEDIAGSLAPKAAYGGPDPRTLAGLFQQAKESGDIERAKGYGRWLKTQFNWEYGEG